MLNQAASAEAPTPEPTRPPRKARGRSRDEPVHQILRRWRRSGEPKMTLLGLAFLIKRSLTTVSRWEAGGRTPKLHDIRAMEEVKPGLVRMLFPKAFD